MDAIEAAGAAERLLRTLLLALFCRAGCDGWCHESTKPASEARSALANQLSMCQAAELAAAVALDRLLMIPALFQ
jgi:hypothetical protein